MNLVNSKIFKSYLYANLNLPPTFAHWLTYMTDLVGTWAITKAFGYDLSPALHIAEAKVIELLSGTSSAQFLMVFLTFEALLFINLMALRNGLKKSVTVRLYDCMIV